MFHEPTISIATSAASRMIPRPWISAEPLERDRHPLHRRMGHGRLARHSRYRLVVSLRPLALPVPRHRTQQDRQVCLSGAGPGRTSRRLSLRPSGHEIRTRSSPAKRSPRRKLEQIDDRAALVHRLACRRRRRQRPRRRRPPTRSPARPAAGVAAAQGHRRRAGLSRELSCRPATPRAACRATRTRSSWTASTRNSSHRSTAAGQRRQRKGRRLGLASLAGRRTATAHPSLVKALARGTVLMSVEASCRTARNRPARPRRTRAESLPPRSSTRFGDLGLHHHAGILIRQRQAPAGAA